MFLDEWLDLVDDGHAARSVVSSAIPPYQPTVHVDGRCSDSQVPEEASQLHGSFHIRVDFALGFVEVQQALPCCGILLLVFPLALLRLGRNGLLVGPLALVVVLEVEEAQTEEDVAGHTCQLACSGGLTQVTEEQAHAK